MIQSQTFNKLNVNAKTNKRKVRAVCVHFSDKCTIHVEPHLVEIHFDCTEN